MARVLVVDDDVLVRETVRLSLQAAKHSVRDAKNGREALDVLEREQFDLVISDIIMPDMDGIELIRTTRKLYPKCRILAMSGGGRSRNVDYLRMSRDLGSHWTLAKPFTPEQLAKAVDDALATAP